MQLYKVLITPDAETDLQEIRDYIAYELGVPETALSYLRALKDAIDKLSYNGASVAAVKDEPWHSRGLRKITAKNFYVYYLVDDSTDRILVMNVIYSRRDQVKALREKIKPE